MQKNDENAKLRKLRVVHYACAGTHTGKEKKRKEKKRIVIVIVTVTDIG